jgi:hypothetical protein
MYSLRSIIIHHHHHIPPNYSAIHLFSIPLLDISLALYVIDLNVSLVELLLDGVTGLSRALDCRETPVKTVGCVNSLDLRDAWLDDILLKAS